MGYFEDIQRTVCRILPGTVATYGEVARAAGHPRTARQVAWALRDAEIRGMPWQRVLGSGGRILLPGQAGLVQRQLLEREGVIFQGPRVDMKRCAARLPARRAARRRTRASGSSQAPRRGTQSTNS